MWRTSCSKGWRASLLIAEMRAWLLLLVAANLAFWAWTRQFSPADQGTDPEPLQRQVHPEKLKVVPPGTVGVPVAGASRAAPARGCVEWGGFSTVEGERAAQLLEPFALGARLGQRRSEETAHWWVFLPSQGNRQNASRRLDELKALGVEEHFILQDDARWRWAISLGVFRTEEAAKARLTELNERRVRGAQLGQRETQVPRVSFQVRDPDAAVESRLRELQKEFPGSELRDCPPL